MSKIIVLVASLAILLLSSCSPQDALAGQAISLGQECVQPVSIWAAENNVLDTLNQNDALIHENLNFLKGRKGLSFNFNGGYLEIPAEIQADSFSLELWVLPSQLTGFQALATRWDEDNNARSFALTITPSGTVRFDTSPDGNWWPNHKIESGNLEEERWHHIIVSTDSAQNRLFIDGKLAAVANLQRPGLFSLPDYVMIGFAPKFAGRTLSFQGQIDEIKMYSQAIDERAAQELFLNGYDSNC